ncbi:hypothetical protein ABPG75_006816 [Micractinium tetrahymenae]
MAAALLVYSLFPGDSSRMGLTCRLLGQGGSGGGGARRSGPAVELVVAQYSSNLSWVPGLLAALDEGTNLTVYSKGPSPYPGAVQLPNVGREGHTFLYHLHTRYHSLAEVTLFVMGSAGQSKEKRRALRELVLGWRRARSRGMFCSGLDRHAPPWGFALERWQGTTDSGGAGSHDAQERQRAGPQLQHAELRPFGAWYAEYIGGGLPRAWCAEAFLAVHRSRAQQRPRAFYRALLEQLSVGENLEAGHYLERSWAAIFSLPAALPRCQL